MKKIRYYIMILFVMVILLLIPNISKAAVEVTREVYSNNGSMRFKFTGLNLDIQKEYEFGLSRTSSESISDDDYVLIDEKTSNSATVDIKASIDKFKQVISATDKGYITIRKKEDKSEVVKAKEVDLKMPYLMVTNYTVIDNGSKFNLSGGDIEEIECALIPSGVISEYNAYYQYEKITNENIINQYKSIKASKGDFLELQDDLTTNIPKSNWTQWNLLSGNSGYPQSTISVPENGLYYLWVYFSPKSDLKDIYGYILVDNIQPEIALQSISLPQTANVEIGKTLNLTVQFNPSTATNKIVTWTSSDSSVATVDNSGKVTAIKLGSTIITATSQDGNKVATCTVTVTATSSGQNGSGASGGQEDPTTAKGKIPQTGENILIVSSVVALFSIGIFTYFKFNKFRGI